MTPTELNELYDSLSKELNLIEKELSDITVKDHGAGLEVKREEYGDADDQDSYAHEVTDIDRNLALGQQLRSRKEEIQKTMAKIKSGKYGQCENCSLDIHPSRLKAMPIAALCMDCARKLKP